MVVFRLAERVRFLHPTQCPVRVPDLACAAAQTGVDPTLEGRVMQDALLSAIATFRSYGSWTVARAGWVIGLHSPEAQDFSGRTLDEALAWCLVWLMAKGTPGDWGHELRARPFLV